MEDDADVGRQPRHVLVGQAQSVLRHVAGHAHQLVQRRRRVLAQVVKHLAAQKKNKQTKKTTTFPLAIHTVSLGFQTRKKQKNKWKRKLVTRSKTRRRPRVRSLLTREPFRSKIETFVCFFLFIRPRPRHRQTQSKSTSAIHRPHRDTPRNHCPKSRRSQPSCLDRIVVVVVVV